MSLSKRRLVLAHIIITLQIRFIAADCGKDCHRRRRTPPPPSPPTHINLNANIVKASLASLGRRFTGEPWDYIDFGELYKGESGGKLSIAFTARFDNLLNNGDIVSLGNLFPENNVVIKAVANTKTLKFQIYDGSLLYELECKDLISLGKWAEYMFTVDSWGEMRAYRGGSLVISKTDGFTPTKETRRFLYIGKSLDPSVTETWNGYIKHIGIYDGALLDYNTTAPTPPARNCYRPQPKTKSYAHLQALGGGYMVGHALALLILLILILFIQCCILAAIGKRFPLHHGQKDKHMLSFIFVRNSDMVQERSVHSERIMTSSHMNSAHRGSAAVSSVHISPAHATRTMHTERRVVTTRSSTTSAVA